MSSNLARSAPSRIADAEADGSIGKRMREIMQGENRKPPEWLDAKKPEKVDPQF